MKYCSCKKVLILLNEYFSETGENIKLMKDLDKALDEIHVHGEEYRFMSFYENRDEVLHIVNNIKGRNGDNVFDFKEISEFINYLKNLHSHLSEDIYLAEMEYGISRSEAMGDFIYENGYDSYFNGEFQF